jgi:hypothetical protein
MLDAMKVIAQDVDRDAKAAAEALAKKKATIHPGIKLLDDAPAGGGAVGGADPGAEPHCLRQEESRAWGVTTP